MDEINNLCTICNKLFSSKSNLNTHLKTSKCAGDNRVSYDCDYCKNKFSSKQFLNRHVDTCISKKDKHYYDVIIEEYKIKMIEIDLRLQEKEKSFEKRFEDQQKSFDKRFEEQEKYFEKLIVAETISKEKVKHEYVGKENMYKSQLVKYEAIIKDLQDKLATLKAPSIVNNTTTIQVLGNFITQEHIDSKVREHLTDKKMLCGMKGIAQFAYEHILKDENGNLLYACYDVARQKFKYKDKDGNEIVDMNAEKLVQLLGPSVVKKYQRLCEKTKEDIEWYKRKRSQADTTDESIEYGKQLDDYEMKLKLLDNIRLEIIGICNNNKFSTELTKLVC